MSRFVDYTPYQLMAKGYTVEEVRQEQARLLEKGHSMFDYASWEFLYAADKPRVAEPSGDKTVSKLTIAQVNTIAAYCGKEVDPALVNSKATIMFSLYYYILHNGNWDAIMAHYPGSKATTIRSYVSQARRVLGICARKERVKNV